MKCLNKVLSLHHLHYNMEIKWPQDQPQPAAHPATLGNRSSMSGLRSLTSAVINQDRYNELKSRRSVVIV